MPPRRRSPRLLPIPAAGHSVSFASVTDSARPLAEFAARVQRSGELWSCRRRRPARAAPKFEPSVQAAESDRRRTPIRFGSAASRAYERLHSHKFRIVPGLDPAG